MLEDRQDRNKERTGFEVSGIGDWLNERIKIRDTHIETKIATVLILDRNTCVVSVCQRAT